MRTEVVTAGRRLGLLAAFGSLRQSRLKRVGSAYGGWHIPPIDSSWICCTAGVGEDATFDIALAEHGCAVVAVDPTPRAIAHIQQLLPAHPSLRIAPYAIWPESCELRFFPPADPAHVSHSAIDLSGEREPLVVPAKRLEDVMADFSHQRVDLVKLDIEGAEYPVLDALDLDTLRTKVLCVEFHYYHRDLPAVIRAIRKVERRGWRVGHVRESDVTFLRSEL